jgi:hypothetical protein
MQVLQAGTHKFILLELDQATIVAIADQLGFVTKYQDHSRHLILDLHIENREIPLLLFNAADPSNLGWFSRCQFYIDGRTGQVLQTPMSIANRRDRAGRTLGNSIRLRIAKELPSSFRLPGRQALTEQVFYMMFNNFLQAVVKTGVAICGGPAVQPLAGRSEAPGSRN